MTFNIWRPLTYPTDNLQQANIATETEPGGLLSHSEIFVEYIDSQRLHYSLWGRCETLSEIDQWHGMATEVRGP